VGFEAVVVDGAGRLSYAALLVSDQRQISWAGDSAPQANSRFLGDQAASE